jgi:hypothetical protein
VGVLAVAAIAGGYFVFSKANDPYRTINTLDPATYLENANSLRGNIYRMSGSVANALGWSPADGRLFSIEVGQGHDTELLPVLVPSALNHVNLQKGQRFTFEVEVGDGGVLRVKSLRKE